MDLDSFKILDVNYAADKSALRKNCILQQKKNADTISNFDIPTLKIIGCGFIKDKTGMYRIDTSNSDIVNEPKGDNAYSMGIDIYKNIAAVDPETFELVEKKDSFCVVKDKNHTYRASGLIEPGVSVLEGQGKTTELEIIK